jgi:uncharacterized protein YihD (DUF1040 family)
MRLVETVRWWQAADRQSEASLPISQVVQLLADDSGVHGDLSSTTDRPAMSMVHASFQVG